MRYLYLTAGFIISVNAATAAFSEKKRQLFRAASRCDYAGKSFHALLCIFGSFRSLCFLFSASHKKKALRGKQKEKSPGKGLKKSSL